MFSGLASKPWWTSFINWLRGEVDWSPSNYDYDEINYSHQCGTLSIYGGRANRAFAWIQIAFSLLLVAIGVTILLFGGWIGLVNVITGLVWLRFTLQNYLRLHSKIGRAQAAIKGLTLGCARGTGTWDPSGGLTITLLDHAEAEILTNRVDNIRLLDVMTDDQLEALADLERVSGGSRDDIIFGLSDHKPRFMLMEQDLP